MDLDPPLLIIAPLADDFDLTGIAWSNTAKERIFVNGAKFDGTEMIEVIVEGMPFLLSQSTEAETRQRLTSGSFEPLFCDVLPKGNSSIGIAPRSSVADARHLPEINRRLLLLGQWLGTSLTAFAAAWLPSRKIAGFAYFEETVDQYLERGPFPALFQCSVRELQSDSFVTAGLDYFIGREIRLTTPVDYGLADAEKTLVPVIDELTRTGRFDGPAPARRSSGGETLSVSSGDDPGYLDITIEPRTE